MPLKLFKRGEINYIRGTISGQKVYETTSTSDDKLAEEILEKRQSELWQCRIYGERHTVTFEDAVISFLETKERSNQDKRIIKRLVECFGTTKLFDINQVSVDAAYKAILPSGVLPSTKLRVVLAPLTAILNHAARRKWCDRPEFDRPQIPKGKTNWITPDEAVNLIDNSADHLKPLLHFILCTGPRLSEALYLDRVHVDLKEKRVGFWDTKSNIPRHAALPEAAVITLANMPAKIGNVFVTQRGLPYEDRGKESGGQIKTAFKTACIKSGLAEPVLDEKGKPALDKKGRVIMRPTISPHDLRHTWATWFYAVTKDLLLLKSEGGWETLSMVERYAHLMPSEHIDSVRKIWGVSHPRIGVLPGANNVQCEVKIN